MIHFILQIKMLKEKIEDSKGAEKFPADAQKLIYAGTHQ